MKIHYHTEKFTILCEQKFQSSIRALARHSFKIGEKDNCKKCEKLLIEHAKSSANECNSFEKLGYETNCQWRKQTKCNCSDDCAFKVMKTITTTAPIQN